MDFRAGINKMLVRIAKSEDSEQTALGLRCLPKPSFEWELAFEN